MDTKRISDQVVSISILDWLPSRAYHKAIAQQWASKFGDSAVPNQAFNGVITSEKAFNKLLAIARAQLNKYDKIMSDKADSKWIVAQGGTMSKTTLKEKFYEYCVPRTTGSYDDDQWRDVIAYTRYLFEKHAWRYTGSWIISQPRVLYNTYKADHRSSAGVTAFGDRRVLETRRDAVSQAISAPTQVDPILGGMRYKDGKYRNIFCDSIANYYRETRVYYQLFQWLESMTWNKHYSDKTVAEMVQRLNGAASYAADYKGMDFHFTLQDFVELLEQLADALSIPRDQLCEMKILAEELFHGDVVMADEVYIGLKNLLSGLYVTHDPESARNFLNLAYVFERKMGFEVVTNPRKLKANQCFIIVCGDDSAVILGRTLSDDELKQAINYHVEISAYCGQELEWSKVDYSEEVVTFCKNTFALRPLKGFKQYPDTHVCVPKYPCNKALNAIRHPENIPAFPNKKDLIIWTCSIMDNAYGCTSWKSVVKAMIDMNQDLFNRANMTDLTLSDEMLQMLNEDWWFRQYALFDLPKSPTYQLICNLLKIK